MAVWVSADLPDDVFSALGTNPENCVRAMRLVAAVKWCGLGMLSQSKAAGIAGVTWHDLLEARSQLKVSPFQTTPEELARELDRAAAMGC